MCFIENFLILSNHNMVFTISLILINLQHIKTFFFKMEIERKNNNQYFILKNVNKQNKTLIKLI